MLHCDLRDYFDISKPGLYQLIAKFESPDGPTGTIGTGYFEISAEKKPE